MVQSLVTVILVRRSPRKKSAKSFYGAEITSASKQHQRKCQRSRSPQPQQGQNGQSIDTPQQLERSSLRRSKCCTPVLLVPTFRLNLVHKLYIHECSEACLVSCSPDLLPSIF